MGVESGVIFCVFVNWASRSALEAPAKVGLKRRKLDAFVHPASHSWNIGRTAEGRDPIVLGNHYPEPVVSRNHAAVRYSEESGLFEIMDKGSRNGTWKRSVRYSNTGAMFDDERIPPGKWIPILDDDQFFFAIPSFGIRFSYRPDDTGDLLRDESVEATQGSSKQSYSATPQDSATPQNSTYADVFILLIRWLSTGPDWMPNWVWTCLLLSLATAISIIYLYFKYVVN